MVDCVVPFALLGSCVLYCDERNTEFRKGEEVKKNFWYSLN